MRGEGITRGWRVTGSNRDFSACETQRATLILDCWLVNTAFVAVLHITYKLELFNFHQNFVLYFSEVCCVLIMYVVLFMHTPLFDLPRFLAGLNWHAYNWEPLYTSSPSTVDNIEMVDLQLYLCENKWYYFGEEIKNLIVKRKIQNSNSFSFPTMRYSILIANF